MEWSGLVGDVVAICVLCGNENRYAAVACALTFFASPSSSPPRPLVNNLKQFVVCESIKETLIPSLLSLSFPHFPPSLFVCII